MAPDRFSALAMAMGPGVHQRAILETVQFRAGGQAFATLGWPAEGWAVVKIAPVRQAWALALSEGLAPEPGRRRKAGIILVRLSGLDEGVAAELLAAAWSHAQGPARRGGRAGAPSPSVQVLSA
ncbi:hypothetical protein [Caulobacter segnis]|uniref:MmcQ/YjbR family DNA-binding protein n=1 Tax=Caulobacter segnis TaxID=88688 RepID=A0A2W5WYP9_9CAUL|nr:hypothetical protein [Caulobacter segnis]PZR33244.1 MAG: hypothetical protein DI526_14205 [Caulobacter segnis]